MSYTIRRGMTLKDGTRLEPNQRFDGELPRWVVEQGHATPVAAPRKKTAKKAAKTRTRKADG